MRIVHTESSINLGGQELRILEQIRWLQDHGHASRLLARQDSAIFREALRRGLPVYAVPFRGSVNPHAIASLLHILRQERVDLIDCHSSRDASAVLPTRWLGTPVVRTQHIGTRFKNDFFHRFTWKYGNDRIIAVSESIAERIVTRGLGRREKITVIGTGTNLARFRPDVDGAPVRRAYGIPPEAKVIGTVGMIRPDKAQSTLILAVDRILERLPDAWFLIVGSPTRPEYQGEIEDALSRIQHGDRVVQVGFQSDVERFIAASDVIVITSRVEGRSQVIPQAFAMKRPVVATRVGGNPELIEHGRTGFLYPAGDVERLTELVVQATREDTSTMVEAACAFARAELGFEATMAATLRVYREVLGR